MNKTLSGSLLVFIAFVLAIIAAKSLFGRNNVASEQRVSALQADVYNLKARLGTLEALNHDDRQHASLSYDDISKAVIPIDLTGSGYSLVKTNMGNLIVRCQGVEPYLDGQKIKLQIGNPTSAIFNGLTVETLSGKRGQSSLMKAQTYEFTKSLNPGTWTEVAFVIVPAKAEDIGSLSVALTLDQITLQAP